MIGKMIYLENIRRGKRTFYVNGVEEKVWYDNFEGSNTNEKVKIKCGSLMSETLTKIGDKGNCTFNTFNWAFEIDSNDYFAFSHGTYAVVWSKHALTYSKVLKDTGKSYFKPKQFTPDDIKRIIKIRKKRGQRIC